MGDNVVVDVNSGSNTQFHGVFDVLMSYIDNGELRLSKAPQNAETALCGIAMLAQDVEDLRDLISRQRQGQFPIFRDREIGRRRRSGE